MAESFYHTASLCCCECTTGLQPVTVRGVVYLHHPVYTPCDHSDKYFFAPSVSLDEAYVPEPTRY
jgi:hypothetical protein